MELNDLEWQAKLKKLDFQMGFFQQLIFQKSKIALVIASLAAAILITATFGNNILSFKTIYFKIAITILLSLIPISLFVFLLEVNNGLNSNKKNIKEITDVDMDVETKDIEKNYSPWIKFTNKVCAYFPYFGVSLLSVVIGYIILEIWN